MDFKIALLVYTDLNGQVPADIANLLRPCDPPRKLRLADKRLKTYGDRVKAGDRVKTAKTVDSFKV